MVELSANSDQKVERATCLTTLNAVKTANPKAYRACSECVMKAERGDQLSKCNADCGGSDDSMNCFDACLEKWGDCKDSCTDPKDIGCNNRCDSQNLKCQGGCK
jgi:hypothetical protein